ncbi:MAG: hypothetical protein K0M45_04940 [Candidatus Paracaedibacteraceae bacterium]|nr:hypothetical protein [Candidatus Paracaedibacteraceae bacterium]
MLKKRIIPILLLKDDRLWKTSQFNSARDVGYPTTAVRVYESQQADELIIIDITGDESSFLRLVKWIHTLSQEFCAPLTIGGGIRNFTQVQKLFDNGADKILLNSINYTDLTVLDKTASVYGVQAAVVGIDAKRNSPNDEYQLYSNNGKEAQTISLSDHIKKCDQSGAGEFFVQSIELDGKMEGLDLELGQQASAVTQRPVILAGGAGSYSHFEEAFNKTNICGIGCGSIFHFTDSNPLRANAYLLNAGIDIKKV